MGSLAGLDIKGADEPTPPGMTKLMLNSYDGPFYRNVSTKPPRDCTLDEIPVIDLTNIDGSLSERKALASELLHAAETTGFFYIKNHGISEDTIQKALTASKTFFKSSKEKKTHVSSDKSKYYVGYTALRAKIANKQEGPDRKETFTYRYDPSFDPLHAGEDLSKIPQHIKDGFKYEDYIWDVDVPNFKRDVVNYWQSCLHLSRRLIRIIALGFDLPEDYFDDLVTYPGADAAIALYPGHGDQPIENPTEVGLGAHTDLQVFTLLWQDEHRGLQILNKQNEWVWATPIPGTFVVNIADFLMRLSNDRLQSTVHRVLQHGPVDRMSMPFFFGFNFNEKCSVVPTCITKERPCKYEPITCGEMVIQRLSYTEPANPVRL